MRRVIAGASFSNLQAQSGKGVNLHVDVCKSTLVAFDF